MWGIPPTVMAKAVLLLLFGGSGHSSRTLAETQKISPAREKNMYLPSGENEAPASAASVLIAFPRLASAAPFPRRVPERGIESQLPETALLPGVDDQRPVVGRDAGAADLAAEKAPVELFGLGKDAAGALET